VLPRTKLITKVIVLALIVYAGISLFNLWGRTETVRIERDELRRAVAELELENARLEYDIEHYNDPDVKAGIAQSSLGLVLPGEIVFHDDMDGQTDED